MSEARELYLSNLMETLRQSQRYMAIGFGASIFFALLVAAPGEFKEMKAPVGPAEVLVSRNTALALSVAVYWVAGSFATFFVSRIDTIMRLLDDSNLAVAALTYPSVLTIEPIAFRIGASFLPPLLVVGGMVWIFGMELLGWGLLVTLFLVAPYAQICLDLRHPIGERVLRKRAVEAVRKYCGHSDESKKPSSFSVMRIVRDIGCFVRTVTQEGESYYLVPQQEADPIKLSNEEAVLFALTKRIV